MAGAYCMFCGHRCFVYRIIPAGRLLGWSGHLATCSKGKAYDREQTDGYDSTNTINPVVLDGLTYVSDGAGDVHLADESPLGGYVTGCDLFGAVRAVDPVPITSLCPECATDAAGLSAEVSR